MLRGILYLIGALLYVIFPRDLIPDFLVGWGWIDDAIILYVLWRYLRRMFSQQPPDAGDEASGPTAEDRRSRTTAAGDGGRRDPYAILEIGPGAGREEIKAAYRRLANQYHPDKVQHLGREIQELAALRFKEIQWAYDELRNQDR